MINFDKQYSGRVEDSRFIKRGLVKTIKFDELTSDGNTAELPNQGLIRGTFMVKVTGDATLEFQGSAIGGVDDNDWANIDENNAVYAHSNNNEAYTFDTYWNFIRVKVTGVTGTVNIILTIGQ